MSADRPMAASGLAKPLILVVLAYDGRTLGTWKRVPNTTMWRAKPGYPSIDIRHESRACEPHEGGWAIRLKHGEVSPALMVHV